MRCSADGALDLFGSLPSAPRIRLPRLCLALIVLFACISGTAFSQPAATFRGLGLFGGTGSTASDVSADGSVVVGTVELAGGPSAFRWTATESTIRAGNAEATLYPAVSADGSVVAGAYRRPDFRTEAYRWRIGESIEGLGDLPGGQFNSFASDVSANGQIIVGASTTASGDEAFRWTQPTGIVGIGDLPGGRTESTAFGVSADGSVVVGDAIGANNRREAFRWTGTTGMVGLGFLPHGTETSTAAAVSADGSTVVGNNILPPPPGSIHSQLEAFRWTQATGIRGLGDLPGGLTQSNAVDVSADGSVVVGYGTDENLAVRAFWWREDIGMVNLQDLLVALGANLDGWHLTEARGVSYDGRTIVGSGGRNGRSEAWIATLPEVIPEPSSMVLTAAAAAGSVVLVLVRWSRHRQRKSTRLDTAICCASAFQGKRTPDERYRNLTHRFVDPIIGAGL